MSIVILPYKNGSKSVKEIKKHAETLRESCIELRTENSRYHYRPGDIAVNWGRSHLGNTPEFLKHGPRIINKEGCVKRCSNKLTFFSLQAGTHNPCRTPEFTTNRMIAASWQREGSSVCERHKLDGHSAEGLVITQPHTALGNAPLYTKYVKKKDEYRIHLYRLGEHIYVLFNQKKVHPNAQRNGEQGVNWMIRNHDNGFIYQRNNINVPGDVFAQAIRAFDVSGLDFGAVDVIYNQASDKAYVLEINTAPGLEGQSVVDYYDAIKMIGQYKHEAFGNV